MSATLATLALLAVSLLFGGMMLFSFGFAAFLFSALPTDVARQTIRRAFPHFYIFVIISAVFASGLILPRDAFSASLLLFIAVTTLPARQILMPAINRATDRGATGQFKRLHSVSVIITLLHIGLTGAVLARFV